MLYFFKILPVGFLFALISVKFKEKDRKILVFCHGPKKLQFKIKKAFMKYWKILWKNKTKQNVMEKCLRFL